MTRALKRGVDAAPLCVFLPRHASFIQRLQRCLPFQYQQYIVRKLSNEKHVMHAPELISA